MFELTDKQIYSMVSQFVIPSFNETHDRFLMLDHKELYHLGASLKDLGKKWFAFSKMEGMTETVLANLLKIKSYE